MSTASISIGPIRRSRWRNRWKSSTACFRPARSVRPASAMPGRVTLSELEQIKSKPVLRCTRSLQPVLARLRIRDPAEDAGAGGDRRRLFRAWRKAFLTGRYGSAGDVPQGPACHALLQRWRSRRGPGRKAEDLRCACRIAANSAQAEGQRLADLSIQWALAQPGIDVVLAGARTPQEITENAGQLRSRPQGRRRDARPPDGHFGGREAEALGPNFRTCG